MSKAFLAISNGDFNAELDTEDLSDVVWELNEGCQDYAIITKIELSGLDYSAICKILDKYK